MVAVPWRCKEGQIFHEVSQKGGGRCEGGKVPHELPLHHRPTIPVEYHEISISYKMKKAQV